MRQLKTRVLIIGAGAAGMALALYLKRAKIDFILAEKSAPGGKLNNISKITNFVGVNEITGPKLAMNIYQQITNLGVEIFNEEIILIQQNKQGFISFTNDSKIISSIVVIATGVMMKEVKIPGYQKLFHHGISTCAVCDGYLYKDKKIAVIGDNEIADKEFTYLANLTKKIIRIDNRDEKAVEFIGTNKLEAIKTNRKKYPIDAAFIYLKESLSSRLFSELNLATKNGRVVVDANYVSNIKNLYAIGDAINKPLYQIVGAISDASIASASIINYLSHEEK